MKNLARLAALLLVLLPAAARADYKYANAEGEYLVTLPDAPLGETIWAQEGNVPYLDNPPKYGAVGEVARLKRVDPDTGDVFDVHVIFVKADREFLVGLTQEKIEQALRHEFNDVKLQNTKFSFSQGTGTLKWGIFSGFSVSQNNNTLYNIVHYLAGESSITVIKVSYNVENSTFNEYYKNLAKSITYMGQ